MDSRFEQEAFRTFRNLCQTVVDELVDCESFWFDPNELKCRWQFGNEASAENETTAVVTYRGVVVLIQRADPITKTFHFEWVKRGKTH